MDRQRFFHTRSVVPFAVFVAFLAGALLYALDGTNMLRITPLDGWKAFELVTQLDDISAINDVGYERTAGRGSYDGLGTFRNGDHLSVWINHETFLNDTAISRIDLNLSSFQEALKSAVDNGMTLFPTSIVGKMGFAYDSIFDRTFHAISNADSIAIGTVSVKAYSNRHFRLFCSDTSYAPNTFGTDRGFVDSIYLTGEETNGGLFYDLDEATRTLWEVPDFGIGSWENAALVDTGDTSHVAILLQSDVAFDPGDYMRMYVGEKNVDSNRDGAIDFLERNRMRGGTDLSP